MAHRHRVTTIDRDLSGVLQKAFGFGRARRKMTTRWSGGYIAGMPMWWVGRRSRQIKTRRK